MMYPKISIVTACFNMEATIEDTIRSVLSQNYPNLEYIIVDGASTDGTLDIIKKYEQNISLVISEPDNGMYDAINKGFSHATGDIYAWINADDIYMPWALKTIARLFTEHSEVQWCIGQTTFMCKERIPNKFFNFPSAYSRKNIMRGWHRKHVFGNLQQESMFWRRQLWEKAGSLDTTLKVAADFELWIRFARYAELVTVALPISAFYISQYSLSHKVGTTKSLYEEEVDSVCKNLKSKYPSFIIKYFGTNGIVNRLYRLFHWYKTPIYFFSYSSEEWRLKRVWRCASNISLSSLYLEQVLK